METPQYQGQKGRSAYEKKLKEKALSINAKELTLANLFRGEMKENFKISSGNLQATRLKALSANECIFSSDSSLYYAKIDIDKMDHLIRPGTQGKNVSMPIHLTSDRVNLMELHPRSLTKKCEIQSIATKKNSVGDHLIVSTNSKGEGNLYRFASDDAMVTNEEQKSENEMNVKKRRVDLSSKLSMAPLGGSPCFESSWSGIAINHQSSLSAAIVHSFSKRMEFYDLETTKLVRHMHTNMYPTSLSYMNQSPILICAESNQVSTWDIREKSNQGCITRQMPSMNSCIYGLTVSEDDTTVAVGGQDKIVYLYDTRTWRIRTRWKCPLKYDILSLMFSPSCSNLCFVGGLDNELMCGEYSSVGKQRPTPSKVGPSVLQQNHRLGFRGDARWTGLDVYQNEAHDVVLGVCESGSIYLVEQAEYMAQL